MSSCNVWVQKVKLNYICVYIYIMYILYILKFFNEMLVTQLCLMLMTPWTVAPLSLGFSRQEYWSGGTILFSRGSPDSEIEPRSPTLQADSLPSEPFIYLYILKSDDIMMKN